MKSFRIIISGLVQGVGYRYFCYKKAVQYGITGYVKNLYNGNVEVLAQGNESLIKDFIGELKIGPHYASVKSVNTDEMESEKVFEDFSIY